MVYHTIGIMSGSSMDGLDIAYCIIEETGGVWSYTIEQSECVIFNDYWQNTLQQLTDLSAKDLMLVDRKLGQYIGEQINIFIHRHGLEHKIHIIGSHGHTVFHEPQQGMTLQIGNGANIAAETGLAVVSNLRDMDVALGGQGAPIVPIGEKLFWPTYNYFLNIGGICNISFAQQDKYIAYDICSANRVLNILAQRLGKAYDRDGAEAEKGTIDSNLLEALNAVDYYRQPYPKSLKNEFGSETIIALIDATDNTVQDKLATYVEHIVQQIAKQLEPNIHMPASTMLVTGGGAYNTFLMQRLIEKVKPYGVEVVVPDKQLIEHKEALIMALMAVLRWREEENTIQSVTGAKRNSVGGALWMGQS